MPGGRKPRGRRARNVRPRRKQTRRDVETKVIQYTDGLTFAKFYDNNGTDEQGIFTVFPINVLLPASSTKIGNDYNRPATLISCRCTARWTNGLQNPPMVMQLEWNWTDSDGSHSYLSGQTRLKNALNQTLFAVPPLALRARIIDNPSNEKSISVRMNFLGRKLLGTDIPTLEFDLNLKQEKIPIIAHSGNTFSLNLMQDYVDNDSRKSELIPVEEPHGTPKLASNIVQ